MGIAEKERGLLVFDIDILNTGKIGVHTPAMDFFFFFFFFKAEYFVCSWNEMSPHVRTVFLLPFLKSLQCECFHI